MIHRKWVSVTTAWRILRLWMEEWPPIWRVAVNILNKQLQAAYKWWFSSLRVGQSGDISVPSKLALLQKKFVCLRPGLILSYDLSNGKGT